jgi:hypothetical protein
MTAQYSPLTPPAEPATALDVLAVLQADGAGPQADAVMASYFAPGPQPRYDTPALQAAAQAQAEAEREPEAGQ